jgi:hypothetical protein
MLLLLCACALPASAATVGLAVVEVGLSPDAARPEASFAWESGALDALFGAGHIGSNAPIARLGAGLLNPAGLPADEYYGVDEARTGGADWLLLVVLRYRSDGVRPVPEMAVYSLRRLRDGAVLLKGETGILPPAASSAEAAAAAAALTLRIIAGMKDR